MRFEKIVGERGQRVQVAGASTFWPAMAAARRPAPRALAQSAVPDVVSPPVPAAAVLIPCPAVD